MKRQRYWMLSVTLFSLVACRPGAAQILSSPEPPTLPSLFTVQVTMQATAAAWTAIPTATIPAANALDAVSGTVARPSATAATLPAATPTPVLPTPDDRRRPTATPTATPWPTFSQAELPIGALAFIDLHQQLYIREPEGKTHAITHEGLADSPAWNPDGTQLAFSHRASDRAQAELRIYDREQGTQVVVWTDPGELRPYRLPFREIAWSPSGKYLSLSQGCCLMGALYLLDLETRTMAGRYTCSEAIWSPREDLLALTVPQPVERLIPIETGNSTSVALVRPGDITPTIVLTGTVDRLYHAHAWLSQDELLYGQSDLYDGVNRIEHSWWVARIADSAHGQPSVVASHPLEILPARHGGDAFAERLSPWLPGATFADLAWSSDGAWVVFIASQDRDKPWRIYAFHWKKDRLVGPLGAGIDLALAPRRD